MDRNSVNWRGYIPAITTPFDRNGALSETMLASLIDWLIVEGMHGIVIAGTTGEWFSLAPHEKQTLFSKSCAEVRGRIPVIAGCNAFTAIDAIKTANLAAEVGADGVLLTPPPYVKPAPREILAFYKAVNDAIDLPICVYNWPPGTNVDMSLELLTELAALEKVVAIKNSTGDKEHFLRVFRTLKDRVRIFGAPMTEEGIDLVANEKADGTMGAGAVLGRAQPEFFDAIWRGDLASARKSAALDQKIMKAWFNQDYTAKFGSAQAIFKTALNLQGLPGGETRAPILPLEPNEIDYIKEILDDIGRLPKDVLNAE